MGSTGVDRATRTRATSIYINNTVIVDKIVAILTHILLVILGHLRTLDPVIVPFLYSLPCD